MAKQNRVLPTGEIAAVDLHCDWMGNRGVLHDDDRNIRRNHNGRRWIICATDFRGRRVQQWRPGGYTVLFLYDEAVGLAAGHRPCAQCRYPDYKKFVSCWPVSNSSADAIDKQLHLERLAPPIRVDWTSLPTGTFLQLDDDRGAALVCNNSVVPWINSGYGQPAPRPTTGTVLVLTPPSTVETIRAGYTPSLGAVPRLALDPG